MTLREFLVSAFSADELRRFMGDVYGPGVVAELPGANAPLIDLAEAVVGLLQRRGRLGPDLWRALLSHLPDRWEALEAVAGTQLRQRNVVFLMTADSGTKTFSIHASALSDILKPFVRVGDPIVAKIDAGSLDDQAQKARQATREALRLADQADRIDIFAIGPIPVLMALGNELGETAHHAHIHPRSPGNGTWGWHNRVPGDPPTWSEGWDPSPEGTVRHVALAISVSDLVTGSQLRDALKGTPHAVYRITADPWHRNSLRSESDLQELLRHYEAALSEIGKSGHRVQVHIFAAVGIAAAVELGRRGLHNSVGGVRAYQYQDGEYRTWLDIIGPSYAAATPKTGALAGTSHDIALTPILRTQWTAVCALEPTVPACQPGPDDEPALGITWTAARAFAEALSAQTGERWRLPTLEEWQAAAGVLDASDEGGAEIWEWCADGPNEPWYADFRYLCRAGPPGAGGHGQREGQPWFGRIDEVDPQRGLRLMREG